MNINEEIAKAFGAHGAWKTRITQAITTGYSEHKPEEISVDNRCAFGKWLYDPALAATFRSSEDYRSVVQLHADFHRAAGAALSKALDGDHAAAQADLADGWFARAAEGLSTAMIRWQRNAATDGSAHGSKAWRTIRSYWTGRLKMRIWAAVAVPSLAALIAIAAFDSQLLSLAEGTNRMERETILLAAATAAVHELQKERGLSTAVAANADEGIRAKRIAQLELTNRQRTATLAAGDAVVGDLPANLTGRWTTAVAALGSIDQLRAKVDAGSIDPATVIASYSEVINRLLEFGDASIVLAARPTVARTMINLLRISRAKEAAGKERATGSGALAKGVLAADPRRRLQELAVDQAVRFDAFQRAATQEQRERLDAALADPVSAQVEKFRASFADGNIAGMTVDAWFTATTVRIDRLHAVEDYIIEEIRQSAHAAKTEAWRDIIVFTGLIGVTIVCGGIFVTFLTRGISNPILTLADSMRQLAAGHTRLSIPSTKRSDEIGEMARAVLIFQQQALNVEQLTVEQELQSRQRAEDRLRTEAEKELQRQKSEDDRRLALSEMAGHIEGDASAVHTAAQEIEEAVDGQAAIASEMSSSVAEITSTMEELSSSSTQVAEYSQSVVSMADKTWENSKAGSEAMQAMLTRMEEIRSDNQGSLKVIEELGRKSKEISKIMQIIESVADQTKLIAFNAALEASSAGDAGKRFSVVAAEIRRLADNVTASTGEIADKVSEIQDDISHLVVTAEKGAERIGAGMGESGKVADMLAELESAAHQSSSAAQQISLATQQQRTASGQVVIALREIVGASSQTAKSIGRISEVARNMTSLSHQLEKLVGHYQLRSPSSPAGGND